MKLTYILPSNAVNSHIHIMYIHELPVLRAHFFIIHYSSYHTVPSARTRAHSTYLNKSLRRFMTQKIKQHSDQNEQHSPICIYEIKIQERECWCMNNFKQKIDYTKTPSCNANGSTICIFSISYKLCPDIRRCKCMFL